MTSPYLNWKEISKFEKEIGYDVIQERNEQIAIFLGFTPKIEWVVGTEESSCYSPNHHYFPDADSQKNEAKRWLQEQKDRFPDGWVIKEGNDVIKREYYPNFHLDWNQIVEAIKRMKTKSISKSNNIQLCLSDDIFITWQKLYENCK